MTKLNSTVCSLLLAVLLASASAFCAHGESENYYFAREQDSSANNIYQPGSWTNAVGVAPSALSADDVYYLAGDVPGRTSGGSSFPGTLVIGTSDRPGTLSGKYYGGFATFADLVLVNGAYNAVSSGNASNDNRARIAGKITVRSPASSPFALRRGSNGAGLSFVLSSEIVGAANTAFSFTGAERYASSLTLSGDNAAYQGQLLVSGDASLVAGTDDWQVFVDSPTALGGSCPEAYPNAVDVRFLGTARFVFTPNVGAKVEAANRGLTTAYRGSDPSNGALFLEAQAGVDVDFALPIAGSTPVAKIGPGRLTLSGEYTSTGALTCEEGVLVLASESAMAKAGVANATIWLKSPSAVPFSLSNVAFDGATVLVAIDGSSVGTCQLDATCTMTASKTTIRLLSDDVGKLYDGDATAELCLMTVPSTVRDVSADDFEVDLSALPYGLPRYRVEMREVTGGKGVYLVRQRPVVVRAAGDPQVASSSSKTSEAKDSDGVDFWSDGQAVHAEADYLMPSNSIRTSGSSFPGASLTLADGASLMLKSTPFDLGQVFLRPGGEIRSGTVQTATRKPIELSGDICVQGTAEKPAYISGRSDGPVRLQASLHGDGSLAIVPPQKDNGASEVVLLGVNTDFTGRMLVSRTASDGANRSSSTLFVGTQKDALGGAPSSFDYAALTMENMTTLQPTNGSVTLATANRGILVRDNVTASVTGTDVLTLNEPVTFNGVLTKKGAGTLVFGERTWFENATRDGVTETPTADKNKLVLSEGDVQATSSAALKDVVLVAGAGALRADPAVDCGPLGLQLAGVDVSSADLEVRLTAVKSFDVALFTVDATVAESLEGKVAVADPERPSRRIDLVIADATDASGRKTFRARYVRGGIRLLYR